MKKLTFLIMALFVSLSINAQNECGDGVTWTYDAGTKTLTISYTGSGTGAMTFFSYDCSDMPWKDYRSSITTVVIKSGVTGIGNNAFKGCSALSSINIPNSVESIGGSAFSECPDALFTVEGNIKYIGNCLIGVTATDKTSYSMKEGTRLIAGGAFRECTSLSSITIPNTVTGIGQSAFEKCSVLTSVSIPNSVKEIGGYAFEDCKALISVTIPASVTSIGPGAFSGCSVLESVIIPNSVTSIGPNTFSRCFALKSVTIGNSVTSIGGSVFYYCESLESLTILATTPPTLGSDVFYNCSKLTAIYVPTACVSNYETAWSGKYGTATISELPGGNCGATGNEANVQWVFNPATGVLTISGTGAMADYDSEVQPWKSYVSNITTVVIENGVTSIGKEAFEGCTNLASVTIPNSVTSIGEGAFFGCSSLISATIPASVEGIGYVAFFNCTSLTSVTLPASVKSIGAYAFCSCPSLASIVVENGNTAYDSRNNCNAIIKKDGNVLIVGCKNTTIPDDVVSIGDCAFGGCTSLSSITIPNSVESIEQYAFDGCSDLASVTLKSFPTFGTDVFDGVKAGCTFALELNDAEHPYIATVTTNAPDFTTKTYTRTVAEAGKYQALYVPFALSVATDLKDFDVYSLGTITSTSVELTPLTEGSTTANTPYIIKAKAANATIEKTGFDIGTPAENTASGTPFDVVGTYHTVNYGDVSGDWYALKDGKFMKAAAGAYLNPMRFYLKTTSSAKDCLEFVFSEETTGVSHVENAVNVENVGNIYNLAGQIVDKNYKGIVIVNGKKYLNK